VNSIKPEFVAQKAIEYINSLKLIEHGDVKW
jgi:hypothetical protein